MTPVTQRGTLSPEDTAKLLEAKAAADNYRLVVVEMIEKSSYREVARVTGLSTNTLMRWKREVRS